MSETRTKRKIEFMESYWTGGEYGADYVWNGNHGELVRCKDCKHRAKNHRCYADNSMRGSYVGNNWFCADGERRDDDA